MSKVVHFEIYADEPERAVKFFKEVFDWKFQNWDGPMDYWLTDAGDEGEPGIGGAILKRQNDLKILNSIAVKDIDETMAKIEKSGGKIIQPKSEIPGVGFYAGFIDTEGNTHGIIQIVNQ